MHYLVADFDFGSTTTTAPAQPGKVVADKHGNLYKLCLFKGSTVATTKGGAVGYAAGDTTGYTVSPDLSCSVSTAAAGLAMVALAASAVTAGTSYGWVMVRGNARTAGITSVLTDGGVAAAEQLYFAADGAVGGRITQDSLEALRHIGISMVADASTTISSTKTGAVHIAAL